MSSRGRPKGVLNGQGTTVLAPIRKWTAKHELVVQLHLIHRSNQEISDYFKANFGKKVSVTRISQILQDPQAKVLIKVTLDTIRKNAVTSIEEGLTELAVESVDRIRETIEAPFTPGSDAKKHQDNLAMGLVKGFLPSNDANRIAEKPDIPVRLLDRLVSALENSNEAKRITSSSVEEGDFEVLETSKNGT